MSNSISRASARADIAVAYGLDEGTPVSSDEQAEIDATLANHQPFSVLSNVGPGGSDIVGITVRGDAGQPAKTFFAEDSFAFGPKPPLQWQEAPARDTSDPKANAVAAFVLHKGKEATSAENAEIKAALASGAEPETVLSGLDLGMTDVKALTLQDADGQPKTFVSKDTFSFPGGPPTKWLEVPNDVE